MGFREGLPLVGGQKSVRDWQRPAWLCLIAATFVLFSRLLYTPSPPSNANAILLQCAQLNIRPGPPADFHERKVSDRFEQGTAAILILNATIWTGGRNGTEVVYGDILLDQGIIKAVGYIPNSLKQEAISLDGRTGPLNTIDAKGAWVTPGIFDLHSHVGLISSPYLTGAMDVNSPHGPILPWLRSLDALNTRDGSYSLAIAGGLTGGLILPGSGNAIGGQAFPIKYRRTSERTPYSMLVEPPYHLNSTVMWDSSKSRGWRHMKHATGENQRKYGTRMDSTWAFREAYEEARKIKESQDSFCRKAELGRWDDPEVKDKDFPYSLKWEALVDVLRGRVKVNCHTYEAVDIDFLSRLTNEFKFRIAAIHHAHEAYLVPNTLKRFWEGPPAVAIFATNARYKRESYRGSEFAGRILSDNGINVIYKSDHPVINSRYLAFEAQQAHFYSLPTNLALRSLFTEPAIAAGLEHRIGSISEGYDADIVMWDSHPLTLGATPQQVYIDGIPQIDWPYLLTEKGAKFQRPPRPPSWDKEIQETLKYDGLPPLRPNKRLHNVEFVNVQALWQRQGSKLMNALDKGNGLQAYHKYNHTVMVTGGMIVCAGPPRHCTSLKSTDHETVDLNGGFMSIGLTAFGPPLGLSEIESEDATADNNRPKPLSENAPDILYDRAGAIASVDALQFEGRDTLLAYRFGVTSAISASSRTSIPVPEPGTFAGLSVAFRTGASHGLEKDAVLKPHAALHVVVGHNGGPSVSTQIGSIRSILLGQGSASTHEAFVKAAKGELPFVIDVNNADIMVNLIKLKSEVEKAYGSSMNMAFSGAAEAHLIADEIAAAGISVILKPLHAHPMTWDGQRVVPGPPLSKDTLLTLLHRKGINVAIGVGEKWEVRNTFLDVAWAGLDSDGVLGEKDALALASTNLNKIFGHYNGDGEEDDLVVYENGSIFSLESKVVGVISPRLGHVEIF